ncbi:CHAT domain-containing protein [uncultured Aquimarina sp.]|uniref:CHAT domain-containing protein n=1 Tax=uncultured Aquimarina sp. TaxID=575652 RepID=UPI0026152A0E|nr:CHAT domain-containing protein [uncultured Aquimarina sp.]
MGFGNFKSLLWALMFLCLETQVLHSQQKTQTSKFLYDQLDYFLQNPSTSGLLRLSKITVSKENQLLTEEDKLAWVILHANMGYYHNQFGNIPTAIVYYEKAWKTFNNNKLTDYDIIENCLQLLGNLYIKIGDLQKAENTITNYLYLAEQSQNTSKIISAITNLSVAYNNQSNYQKAITILLKGEEIAPKNVNILTNLATNYLDSGSIEEAQKYASKAISIDVTQVNAYQILAAIALENKELQNAKNYIHKAKLQLLKKPNTSARDIAKWQLAYIDILLSKSAYTEALKNLKEIYVHLLPQYSSDMDFPKKEILIADRVLIKALDVQAYIHQQLDEPILAINALEAAFEVNSKLNTTYPLQDTKIIQHSQNRNRTETYIDLLYSLHTSTKDAKYVVKAFEAAENSKAPFVNEALLSKQLLIQYKNDSLVKRNNELTKEIATYDTDILKEKQKEEKADISKIQKWTSAYEMKSIELKDVTEELQKKYPNLLLKQEKVSLSALQEKLKQDDFTLIEYFFGKKTVYRFKIDANSIEITKTKDIEHFRTIIRDYIRYFNKAATITNNVKGFTESSFELYNILKIPNTKKIVIIPDGLLNFIPFETLLTKKTNVLSFEKMPFLLKSSIISYEISANKYLRSNSNNIKPKILGVFPVFENTNIELPFSLEEQSYIQQKFDGVFLEKEEATYAHFLDEAKKHSILHLSTHAEAGSFSRPASIQFRDQNILVNQLYGLQLEADLVVLSACETGIGTLAKGEGPLSIGRGFQYAGVPNVLFSLWKVNDKTTSQLMHYFYQNLHLSNSYVHGLHKAKLDFLEAKEISNTQKSPYYWASFVYYGNYQSLTEEKSNWIFIIGGFLLIILFLFVIRQKLK